MQYLIFHLSHVYHSKETIFIDVFCSWTPLSCGSSDLAFAKSKAFVTIRGLVQSGNYNGGLRKTHCEDGENIYLETVIFNSWCSGGSFVPSRLVLRLSRIVFALF